MKQALIHPKTLAASLLLVVGFARVDFVLSAHAITLSEAKEKGLVGEKQDGYLGAVSDDPEVRSLVSEINQKRRFEYQNIAKKNKATISDVESLAAKKAIEKSSHGHLVQSPSGEWRRK